MRFGAKGLGLGWVGICSVFTIMEVRRLGFEGGGLDQGGRKVDFLGKERSSF